MDFLIQVRWSRGSNPLLQRGDVNNGPTIEVAGDGGLQVLSQNHQESGEDYLVKSPSSEISFKATFHPTIGGNQADVLTANQTYTVSGSDLIESSATVGPTATKVNKHPLVTGTKQRAASTGTQTVFTVKINTDFVDATAHWKKLVGAPSTCKAEPFSCWDAYAKLHESGTELVVLGFTAGSPVVWFVVVPDACKAASEVSSLVFFRPASYVYSTIDDPQHASGGMYALSRYLLRPRSPDPGVWWAWDRYHMITAAQLATVKNVAQFYDWLCASFENSLAKSGRKVILVYPWPTGTGFGEAQGSNLASHLASIRALLYAQGKIGVGQTTVTGGKLGVAGYSRGGPGMFACIDSNKALIREVYGFDPNGADGQAANLALWAFETSDFRLRLAGGFASSVTTNESIARTVNARLALPGRKASGGVVSTHPASPSTFYQPASAGGHKWWNHVFTNFPAALTDPGWKTYVGDTRHQFVIYGGEDAAFAPSSAAATPWTGQTFLEQFLSGSTF
jgi:hypothetical protein